MGSCAMVVLQKTVFTAETQSTQRFFISNSSLSALRASAVNYPELRFVVNRLRKLGGTDAEQYRIHQPFCQ
jgi:hypothetical protein